MYFTANTYTKESLSAEYKSLAKKLHPDVKGGSEAAFKAMKAEYDVIIEKIELEPIGIYIRNKPQYKAMTNHAVAKKEPAYEVTPEDIQRGLELLSEFFKLINKTKKPKR